jgi:ATP-dependent Clp endopeptidase proteolytic subunit ClpP
VTVKQPDFRIQMSAPRKAEIAIYDVLGPSWAGMIDAKLVDRKIKEAGPLDEIDVRLNTPGGSAYEGLAIHNLLKDHPAKVTTIVDGVAASAGSLILMAGDVRRVPKNALVMIHNPSTAAWGEKDELLKAANRLDQVKSAAIETYAARTGLSAEKLAKMMDDETWLNGTEAVAQKFATEEAGEVSMSAATVEVERYQELYRNTPQNFGNLIALTAMTVPKENPVTQPTAPVVPAAPSSTAPTAPENKGAETPSTPVTTPAPQASAPTAPAASEADRVQMAIADERKRVADITAACKLAGHSELAQDYINQGTTLADVQTALFTKVCAEKTAVGGPPVEAPKNDANAKYVEEYKAGQYSMSQDEYVAMRRVDDGLDVLVPGSAAK